MSLSSLKSISFQLQKHITQPVKSRNNRKALKNPFSCLYCSIHLPTDYGRPIKPFFIEIQNFWVWQTNSGAFGVFSAKLCSPLFNHYFYKKTKPFSNTKPFHPHIYVSKLNIYIHFLTFPACF